MRGLRKLPTPKKPGRRFPDREDAAHLRAVRGMRCLLMGRRTTVTGWRGTHPNKQQVQWEAVHSCVGAVQAHHVVLKSQGGHDDCSVPLCAAGHHHLHDVGPKAFEATWSLCLKDEAKKLSARLRRESA